jgi:hypothetical protein
MVFGLKIMIKLMIRRKGFLAEISLLRVLIPVWRIVKLALILLPDL